jgi:hypothetical protein
MLIKIDEKVFYQTIAGGLLFSSYVESEIVIHIANCTKYGDSGASRWRNGDSQLVIFGLPYLASSFPQMGGWLIKEHDFSSL